MFRWMSMLLVLSSAAITAFAARGGQCAEAIYEKVQLSSEYYAEGANVADFDRDGHQDVVAGPYWYAGPDFKKRHAIYDGRTFPNDRGYSDNFFSFIDDFDADGWPDLLTVGLPGTPAYWYANNRAADGHWKKHEVFPAVDNESPTFVDLTGDGKKELICSFGGKLGYVEPDRNQPEAAWTFHPISAQGHWQRYTHGMGVGDVNGDGRLDYLMATGWWEQPESLEGDPQWTAHPFPFSQKRGGAQMFAYDIDGDGDNDVLTSLDAHGWGLSWFEHVKDEQGKITFKEHKIMGESPEENPQGVAFSQLHAMDLADHDNDGLLDLVTGKCYWAHNGADPGARDPAVVYWFRLERDGQTARFVPVQVDDNSGVGRQVTPADLNGDGLVDVVASNKKGVFVFLQRPSK